MNYGVIKEWPPTVGGAFCPYSHDTERLSDNTQANSTVEMGSLTDEAAKTRACSVLLEYRFENDS